jgi:hypothetical protein
MYQSPKDISPFLVLHIKGDGSLVPVHGCEIARHFLLRTPHGLFTLDSPVPGVILNFESNQGTKEL